MAVQTIGRIRTQGYCVNHLLSRTVMAGGAGTGSIGGNIMFSSIYFSPVRHNMTVGTEGARRIKRKIVGAFGHCMYICCMDRIKRIDMTRRTVGRGRVANGRADQRASPCIMAAGTRIMRFRGCAYKCIIMAVTA